MVRHELLGAAARAAGLLLAAGTTASRINHPGVVHIEGRRHESLAEAKEVVARYGFELAKFPLILAGLRNPYALEVSRYSYLQSRRPGEGGRNQNLALRTSFETFAVESTDHRGEVNSIRSYFEIDGRMPPNLRILRCESLEDDLRGALTPLGIVSAAPLQRLNTSRHDPFESYYTPAAEEAVFRRYRWVFDQGFYPRMDPSALPTLREARSNGTAVPLSGPVRQEGCARSLAPEMSRAVSSTAALEPSPASPSARPRRYAFVFVCQAGPLEQQALLLAASLRTHLRCEHELVACIPEPRDVWGTPAPATLDALRELGGRLAPIVNPIDPRCTHANKIACLATPTEADKIVFLDTDMVLLKDFHDEPRFGAPLNVKLADYQMFDRTDRLWRIAYAAAGVPLPTVRFSATVSGDLGLPYFNSGFLAINAGIPLADAWAACARRLNAEAAIPKREPWSDQTALPIAVQMLNLEYDLLDESYNHPAHVRPLPRDGLPWFCHYHKPAVIRRRARLRRLVQGIAARHPSVARLLGAAAEWSEVLKAHEGTVHAHS